MNAKQLTEVKLISREEARASGFIRYFSGAPCMRGHIAERLVTNTRCVQCHNEKAKSQRAPHLKSLKTMREAIATAESIGRPIVTREEARSAGIKRYFTAIPCSKGHICDRLLSDHSCVICSKEKSAKERRDYPQRVRDRVRKSYRKDIDRNRQRARNERKMARLADPEKFRARARERRATDPVFAFNHRARQLVRSALLRSGFRKAIKTEAMLGCTLGEFREHIERQFTKGMGWHNMGFWEIDHIIPISTARSQAEAEMLNRASNLRPLWTLDNRTKNSRITHLL